MTALVTANELLAAEELWWYVARAGGIVAMALVSLSVIWGLLLSTKVMNGRPSPQWLLSLHRFLGGLSLTFTGVHIAALMADSYVHFGWLDVLVPFTSSWRPGAVALGVVSTYLLVAVQLTSVWMKKLPRAWWKRVHLSSYVLFWTGLVHGATAGSDATQPWYVGGTALATITVLFLTIHRALMSRRARRVVPAPALG